MPEFSANISIMFTELPYLRRPQAAHDAGFATVESWWPFPEPAASRSQVDRLVSALEDAQVQLSGLNFFAGDMPGGQRGVACRPDRQTELVSNTEQLVEIAERTGCRAFNLLYGQLDERYPVEEQHLCAVAAIRRAAGQLAVIDGVVLLEPLARGLNGNYPLQTGEDVVSLLQGPLDDVGNARLLFDLFHLGANGVDIVAAASRLMPWIGHVQIADSPGRGEPGTGSLPITETLRTLADAGYAGLFACEYKPTGPTAESLAWMASVAA
jgi:hydroxypyruvate isomerase